MKYTLTISLLFTILTSFATIIEVKQDSTGDFIIIQEAINFAQTGDTVLIWPGIYYENVDLLGKSITLASLALTTGDNSYKYTTLINGNKSGTCVLVMESDSAVIHSLTLTNGSGYQPYTTQKGTLLNIPNSTLSLWDSLTYGGGVFCEYSKLHINNCIIKNNKTNSGSGGIQVSQTDLFLSNTSIYNNHTYGGGGGIGMSIECSIEFDSINRCNIYSNSASYGCDLVSGSQNNQINIIVDTISVFNPEQYFAIARNINGYPISDLITVEALNQKVIPFDGDLYVNPVNGNDTNSGTTSDQPLKTIFYALSKIIEDSINKNTIHLANGVYSDTANGEKFPLNVRSNVIMEGESMAGVIWDGRNEYRFLKGNNLTSGYSFKKITMKRGKHKFRLDAGTFLFYAENADILLDSITVTESTGLAVVANLISCNNATIKNCVFSNNRGGNAAVVAGMDMVNPENSYSFINCKFFDNMPDWDNPPGYEGGGGLAISGNPGSIIYNTQTILVNCLFIGNNDIGFSSIGCSKPYVINCTFANNCLVKDGVGVHIGFGSDVNIYNSIIYNNGQWPMQISNWETNDTAFVGIYNSLVDGGEESIEVFQLGDLYYAPTNIDADPNFLGMWSDPYMIADGSPCIDAGTLSNLPDFIELPEFDLAGNPRIVGDSIDMGAYEWNSTIVGFNEIGPGNRNEKPNLLKASPNPFDWGTYLSVEVEAEVKVEVYDNYGRLVRSILSTTIPGKQEILWYGDDNNGNPLPAGVYHVVMFSGEREVESLKLIKK